MGLENFSYLVFEENIFVGCTKEVINMRLYVIGLALAPHVVALHLAHALALSHVSREDSSPAPLPGRDVSQITSRFKVNYLHSSY